MFNDLLKHRSGRVISLARLVLAATFLFAVWIDPSQPTREVPATYAMLVGYLALALVLLVLTWNNWWLDARAAVPAHVLDTAVFTLLVFATDGYTSPFFVFFVFLVLSAAIRWGWRQTAITAVAVILLYFAAGLVGGDVASPTFDLQRFIIRSSNLVILSALLIWFGVNHGFSTFGAAKDELLEDESPEDDALQTGVAGIAKATGAAAALLLWRASGRSETIAVAGSSSSAETSVITDHLAVLMQPEPFLFDVTRNRTFARGLYRRMRFLPADQLLDMDLVRRFGIVEGLAIPVRTDAGEGMLLLHGISSLCTDHIEFGTSIGTAFGDYIQRNALLSAVQDNAAVRARLSLARDLHDSIVQFLAGATFRIEAIGRAIRSGDRPARELDDLKQLMLEEQQELRSAIGALRSSRISLPRLASDLKALCDRLARQWDINCDFTAEVPDSAVPMRLHLDTHQLIREAVANAVRHAGAKSINVHMSAEQLNLRLDISNDGNGKLRLKEGRPWSLRERVDEANGTLMLASRKTGTNVSITLPLMPEPQP